MEHRRRATDSLFSQQQLVERRPRRRGPPQDAPRMPSGTPSTTAREATRPYTALKSAPCASVGLLLTTRFCYFFCLRWGVRVSSVRISHGRLIACISLLLGAWLWSSVPCKAQLLPDPTAELYRLLTGSEAYQVKSRCEAGGRGIAESRQCVWAALENISSQRTPDPTPELYRLLTGSEAYQVKSRCEAGGRGIVEARRCVWAELEHISSQRTPDPMRAS
jgi:hypothetical protein